MKNNKPQTETKSFDTSEDFPNKNETKELLEKIDGLNKELENEKNDQKLKITKAEEEIEKLKKEILTLENNEKSYKDKIDPIELQNLQLSVKISNLEKQLRDSRTAIFQEPAVEPVKEPVEIKVHAWLCGFYVEFIL